MVLRREEMLTDFNLPKDMTEKSDYIELGISGFPWLKTVALSFERYYWQSLTIHWRPAGGYNRNGLMALGMNWHTISSTKMDRTKVLTLTPHISVPIAAVNTTRSMPLPKAFLNSRKFYSVTGSGPDSSTGTLQLAVKMDASGTDQFVGEVWASYQVVLQGTRS